MGCFMLGLVFDMAIRPIPKQLLIHDVEIVSEEKDRWGDPIESSLPIKSVRVEHKSAMKQNGNVENVDETLIMYHDTTHSKPFVDFKDKEGTKVQHDNGTYTIVSVEQHYALDTQIHHQEVVMR